MSQKHLPQASLIFVELGAVWPAALIAGAGPCRVLAEAEGEGPLAFAARAEAFATSAFPRGTTVASALLACNQRADETAEAARRAMAECLLARISPSGSLCFATGENATDRFRRRLLDLTCDLGAGAREGRVSAWFGEQGARIASGPATSQSAAVPDRTVARVA
jgi:hypothetical protein